MVVFQEDKPQSEKFLLHQAILSADGLKKRQGTLCYGWKIDGSTHCNSTFSEVWLHQNLIFFVFSARCSDKDDQCVNHKNKHVILSDYNADCEDTDYDNDDDGTP